MGAVRRYRQAENGRAFKAASIVVFRGQKTKARAFLGLHPDSPIFPTLTGKSLNGKNGPFRIALSE
jgi:hypothetical protein